MKTSKDLIAEKYSGYESFCYICQMHLLSQIPFCCPKCGNSRIQVHEWKSGAMVGYAKIKKDK
jgi:hypothetical protein